MTIRLRLAASAALLSTTLFIAPALAQEAEDPGESRSATFEAASGAQMEDVPGGLLMIVAYGLVWLFVVGYVATLARRQATTTAELERLRRDLAERGE